MARTAMLLALAACLSAGAALAPAGPSLIPSRDVDITYRVTLPNEAAFTRRVRWQAGTGLERVDEPGDEVSIIDHKTGYETLLRRRSHSFLKIALPSDSPLNPNPNVPRARSGQARVAGLSCTEWTWTDHEDGTTRSICVTDDGALLRETVDGHVVVRAKSVDYHKMKAAIFRVPESYEPALAPDGPSD